MMKYANLRPSAPRCDLSKENKGSGAPSEGWFSVILQFPVEFQIPLRKWFPSESISGNHNSNWNYVFVRLGTQKALNSVVFIRVGAWWNFVVKFQFRRERSTCFVVVPSTGNTFLHFPCSWWRENAFSGFANSGFYCSVAVPLLSCRARWCFS